MIEPTEKEQVEKEVLGRLCAAMGFTYTYTAEEIVDYVKEITNDKKVLIDKVAELEEWADEDDDIAELLGLSHRDAAIILPKVGRWANAIRDLLRERAIALTNDDGTHQSYPLDTKDLLDMLVNDVLQ
jgi:hypothetical protein